MRSLHVQQTVQKEKTEDGKYLKGQYCDQTKQIKTLRSRFYRAIQTHTMDLYKKKIIYIKPQITIARQPEKTLHIVKCSTEYLTENYTFI